MVFEGSREPGGIQDDEQPSEPERLGGGRGRVNPPPGACFGGLGGLEGLKLVRSIYTPRGQRPRRIKNRNWICTNGQNTIENKECLIWDCFGIKKEIANCWGKSKS